MPIEFNCPNGHRLSCPEQIAGRHGKCPKCGAAFRVPLQNGGEAQASDSQSSYPNLNEIAGASGRQSAPQQQTVTPPEGFIVFLCPNGHRLNGPLTLQGKPGQCPHCHARFLIPTYDSEHEEDVEIVDDALPEDDQDLVQESDSMSAVNHVPPLTPAQGVLPPVNAVAVRHSMSELFTRFWEERARDSSLELTLKDGTRLVPQIFGDAWSTGPVAVLSVLEDDGSPAVVAVPWDSIARITLRGARATSAILRELNASDNGS